MTESRPDLQPVERLDIQVLVDNVTDHLSTNPEGVQSEFDRLLAAGLTEIAGEAICSAHHGLSLLLTAHAGGARHTLLLDTGPEAYAVERNSRVLGIDLGAVGSVVLSHGHWDHCGGALRALELIGSPGRMAGPAVYAHPGMFRPRGRQLADGGVMPLRPIPTAEAMTERGATVVVTTEARLLHDGRVYLSGEIPRVTAYERGLAGHLRRRQGGDGWEPDPLIVDERFLAVHVHGQGLVVLTGCSHAGVVNVLTHARALFPDLPLHAVIGGLHLSGADPERRIADTVKDLGRFGLGRLVPGHCTGWRAFTALVNAFGDGAVAPSAVGKRFVFAR
jgi:7,8-dihydropterin-6-yl-methyl-4-(beta-D-ribofuranosyl)aminobenzene 5'-phosphate synthase